MDVAKALDIAKSGTEYLARQADNSGMFVYERNKRGEDVSHISNYNILRHCGCIWAMKPLLEESNLAIRRALNYSLSQITQDYIKDKGYQLKLGGNALAALAYKGNGHESFGNRMVNGMLYTFLCPDTGRIKHSKFKLYRDGTMHESKFISEYYPGEAALALCEYGQYDIAYKVCMWLRLTRDAKLPPLQDHWLLQALERLYTHYKEENPSRASFCLHYASLIAAAIIQLFNEYDRVTPTACRTEGLIAYYNIDPSKIVLNAIKRNLEIQASFQCSDNEEMNGAFFENTGKTRIDYTQHNISAFYRYYKLFEQK